MSSSGDRALFFAAMDADTDGEEGKYYSFKKDELEEISKNTDFDLLSQVIINIEYQTIHGKMINIFSFLMKIIH